MGLQIIQSNAIVGIMRISIFKDMVEKVFDKGNRKTTKEKWNFCYPMSYLNLSHKQFGQ